jgi:hypothetical protein
VLSEKKFMIGLLEMLAALGGATATARIVPMA